MSVLIETRDIKKQYLRGEKTVDAIRGISLTIQRGEFITFMGPSGSGKSTLLHLIGGLERPSSGSILLKGHPIESYSDEEMSVFRRRHFGFVFQFFNLMTTLNALENVALPLLLDGQPMKDIEPTCKHLLSIMGLEDRAQHFPHQLSGGEMQRIAIARALVADPLVVFADEPTGNLDSENGLAVYELLTRSVRDRGKTLLMVTHDPKTAVFADRVIYMRDGRIESCTEGGSEKKLSRV